MIRVPLFCKIFRFSIFHDASANEMKIDLSVQLCIDGKCENMKVLDDGRMPIPSCDANFGDFDYELSGIHHYYKAIHVPNQMSPYTCLKSSILMGAGHVCLNSNFRQNFPWVTHDFTTTDNKFKT